MIKTKNLQAGDCLIAPPNNKDPRFRKTVILLADHADTQGSMGIVLNRPSEHRVGALVDGLADNIKDHQLYWGGPVQPHVVFMLHTLDWQTAKTKNIDGRLGLTTDIRMFDYMKNGEQPDHWQVYFGHSGWAPGQLTGELSGEGPWTPGHSWLTLNRPSLDFIYETDPDSMWDWAVQESAKQAVTSWF